MGMFCKNSKCAKLAEIDETCGEGEAKCVPWGMCNNSTCVLKRSLNMSKEVESSQLKELCFHNHVYQSEDGKIRCGPGPFLDESHVSDRVNDMCRYYRLGSNSRSFINYGFSTCGHGNTTSSYCSLL